MSLVKVARVSDIPQGRSKLVKMNGEEIALWHVGEKFYAVNNVCSHQHISALHQGTLDGLRLTCPMHGWTYSLETGIAESGSGRVRTYQVVRMGEDLLLEEPESTRW